jgi:putative GTP pyrophosphokinase
VTASSAHGADLDPATLDWVERYRRDRPKQEEFTVKMELLVSGLLSGERMDVASLSGRTKTVSSFAEKLTRKGEKYADPLRDLPDLTGIRVVVPYLRDVPAVVRVLKEQLSILSEDRSGPPPEETTDRFGYRSVHLVVGLGRRRASLSEWAEFASYHAEIQVRTILQHAWASASHKTVYKKEERGLPVILRRRLARLSALLELADDELSALASDAEQLGETYASQVAEGDLTIPLNLMSMQAYLEQRAPAERVAALASAAGWSLIMDREAARVLVEQDRVDLVRIAEETNVGSVSEIDALVREPRASRLLADLHKCSTFSRNTDLTTEDLLTRLLIIDRRCPAQRYARIYSSKVVQELMCAMQPDAVDESSD